MLNLDVSFGTMLIGAEGARSSKMHSHFLRAVFIRGCLFNVLRKKRTKGDPTGGNAEEAMDRHYSGNQQASLTELKKMTMFNSFHKYK
ncbi:hypothetical protein CVD28_26290 [Bacillus sp. M6-12]|nr:hypothetical protein CVD28_26290 [Bacillus sp. M6-12]